MRMFLAHVMSMTSSQAGDDEQLTSELKMRKSCNYCVRMKRACDGKTPCELCTRSAMRPYHYGRPFSAHRGVCSPYIPIHLHHPPLLLLSRHFAQPKPHTPLSLRLGCPSALPFSRYPIETYLGLRPHHRSIYAVRCFMTLQDTELGSHRLRQNKAQSRRET